MESERDPLWYRFARWQNEHPRLQIPILILFLLALLPFFLLLGYTLVRYPHDAGEAPGTTSEGLLAGLAFWLLACVVSAWIGVSTYRRNN